MRPYLIVSGSSVVAPTSFCDDLNIPLLGRRADTSYRRMSMSNRKRTGRPPKYPLEF